MNRKQRDANRQTAREARHLLYGPSLRFTAMAGGGSMAALSSRNLRRGLAPRPSMVCFDDVQDVPFLPLADLTEGARRILFGIDPEQDPPVLVEASQTWTKVLGYVRVSASVLSPIRYIDAPAKESP
jgi:hypothetical protein